LGKDRVPLKLKLEEMTNKVEYELLVILPNENLKAKFEQFSKYFDLPGVTLKSTDLDRFNCGEIVDYDVMFILSDESITEEEYEAQRQLLEFYFNAPGPTVKSVFNMWATLSMPEDLKAKCEIVKMFNEETTYRE